MKIIFTYLVVTLGSIIFLSSCGEIKNAFTDGPDFTVAEEISGIEEMLMKHINADMEIINIDFSKADTDVSTFSKNKGKATISYVNPENAKKKLNLDVDLKTGDVTENTLGADREHHRNYTGVKNVTALGCGKIADNIGAAGQLLAADSTAYNGIGSYKIVFDSRRGTYKHEFSLERRTGSDSRMIYYDEYSFVADADGNVKASK
jgi:hypothetical protein